MTVKWDHVFRSFFPTISAKKIISNHNYTNEEGLVWGPANQVADKFLQRDEVSTQNVTTRNILDGSE